MFFLFFCFFEIHNSLTPKSLSGYLISPYHITPEQNIKKNGTDYQLKKLCIV